MTYFTAELIIEDSPYLINIEVSHFDGESIQYNLDDLDCKCTVILNAIIHEESQKESIIEQYQEYLDDRAKEFEEVDRVQAREYERQARLDALTDREVWAGYLGRLGVR